jgi:PAS domain S-box-containing protein
MGCRNPTPFRYGGQVAENMPYEEKLERNLELYRTLVEYSLTGLYIDLDGIIVFANPRFAEMYRYTRDEILGMESRKLVHPEDRDLTDKMREERLTGGDVPTQYDARGLTRDGETIWVRRRNTDIEYEGKAAILGNVVDITEQKQVREEMKELVHAVTHDLKTPLVAVHGFSERLLKNYGDKLGETGRDYAQRIMEGARRMESLISDLRDLPLSGEKSLKLTDVPARSVVDEVVSDLKPMLNGKNVDLAIQEELPVVQCDKEKLYQVFSNLIGNSVKYMAGTPSPRVEVGGEDQGEAYRFFVRDNGVGIAPGDQEKIFERFQRLKHPEELEGTGLGLSIVKGIVESHGGRIWVESEKGRGTTFYFTLPKEP